MMHVTWGLVIACGKGEQLSPEADTPFLSLGSQPVLSYSLLAFEQCQDISGVVVVVSKDRIDTALGMAQMFGFSKVRKIVAGGGQRHVSVLNGLKAMDEDVDFVSVHDASRPGVTPALISETIKTARKHGSGVVAVEIADSVKEVAKGMKVSKSLKDNLWLVQTPQTYRRDLLQKGYETARKKSVSVDEDSSAVELAGHDVHLVPAEMPCNRIRKFSDFNLATTAIRS